MKVVKNSCFGGFGLSGLALYRLSEITGKTFDQCMEYYVLGDEDDKIRTAPELIQVVEELGEKANDSYSYLMVVEVPDDVNWYINNYDGWETIEEVHRSW